MNLDFTGHLKFLTGPSCLVSTVWGVPWGGKMRVLFEYHVRQSARPLMTWYQWHFLIIKPTSCTIFSNLFLEWNFTCFGQFLCPSSEVFHYTQRNGVCLLTACEKDQDETAVPSWSCSQAVSKTVWHIPLLCVQWKTPYNGQRNCPKHVEFHSKNKFEKLVHLVGFIIRNLTRCTVTWTSKSK